ncbi:bacitracin ABC transporter ATP-binding protein [Anaerocolumna cellulosilytica]|uniref:Bacitracin ABC transporter ATP-binding protein n=1 Tax=Anaerocolumna cellulosilytica TaxID=433286 RepID=A0A6S6QQR3_9FIRM|nr:ABC transporter ATP-binding protein [Anaerocolumna cellulosilytica]MBB5196034.1 ABC-2 type transport system ATP-binding protein [Anaerocolumna cellulosilytica]BCJ93663.1 bacitracin ABC transporter ATP-binding protein [Anaerocolumna cellulosilytica]
MSQIIKTNSLSKRYGSVYRVKAVNLDVQEGDIYGFLGPNGAGKSTTLKMILGLAKPTEGQVSVFGKEFEQNRGFILSQTGSLIEAPSYYGHLTGLENLRVVQKLREVPDKNVKEVLSIVRLINQKDKKVSQYSLGMKQRLGIAMALLSFPKLLILDEPTNGLDPSGIGEIRELIKSLPSRYGMTVLISSHLLSEIEQIATTLGIINDGTLGFQGSLKKLQEMGSSEFTIKTRDNQSALALLKYHGFLADLQGEELIIGRNLREEQVVQANRLLVSEEIGVYRIEEHKKNLESIFLDMTGKEQTL